MRVFVPRTRAFRNFTEHIRRTEELLGAGLSGLGESVKTVDAMRKKLEPARQLPRGKRPSNPQISVARRTESGELSISMDDYSAKFILGLIEDDISFRKLLRFHLFAILLVDSWGAFETYITSALEEIFRRQRELLTSNETVTVKEVLYNVADPLTFLITRQVDRVANMKLGELLTFLETRTNFVAGPVTAQRLREVYLVRNIIAHNSGLVRPSMVTSLPGRLTVVKGELRVTKEYLRDTLKVLAAVVRRLERHFEAKYFERPGR